jgi:hypothetical protein
VRERPTIEVPDPRRQILSRNPAALAVKISGSRSRDQDRRQGRQTRRPGAGLTCAIEDAFGAGK